MRARRLTGDEAHALAAARLLAAHRLMPYLATALFRLRPFAVDGLGTFGVDDRWRLFVDPAVLAGWGVRATAGVLLHEVGHALRDDAGAAAREGPLLDRYAWNLCADAAINDDLVASGVHLPGVPVLPKDLRDRSGAAMPVGWTAARYYAELPRRDVEPPGGAPLADDEKAEPSRSGGHRAEVRSPGTRAPLPAVVVDGRIGDATASCGSVAGGAGHDVEVARDALDPGDEDGGVRPVEQQLTRRAVAAAVHRTARRGEVPAGLRRWADDQLAPATIPWQQQLRAAVRRGIADVAGGTDTTYARPSRRRVPGVVLPGTRRPVPRVAVVLDTSASMHAGLLDEALAEVEGVARSVGRHGHRVEVLTVDATVHATQSVTAARDVTLLGGGGTDLTPGLVAAVAGRTPADVVVTLTDGFTPWPDAPPRRSTRWVVAILGGDEPGPEAPPVPAWARAVHVGAGT